MEAALVGGLVAQVEGELFLVGDLAGGGIVARGFEMERALAEPVMLGHGFDERGFGEGGGLVLVTERGEERIEFGLRFGGEDAEGSRETVARASLWGPVDSLAFSRLASIWDSVDKLGNAPSYASLDCGRAGRGDAAEQSIERAGDRRFSEVVTGGCHSDQGGAAWRRSMIYRVG